MPPPKPSPRSKTAKAQRRLEAVPEVFDPAYELWKLRQQAIPWKEAAGMTGYASIGVAKMALAAFLQQGALERTAEQRAQALALSVERYERIIQAYWEDAIVSRKPEAAAVILRAMAQSDRVQKLDADEVSIVAPRTIVVAADPEAYVATLRAVAEGVDPDLIPNALPE